MREFKTADSKKLMVRFAFYHLWKIKIHLALAVGFFRAWFFSGEFRLTSSGVRSCHLPRIESQELAYLLDQSTLTSVVLFITFHLAMSPPVFIIIK